MKARGMKVDHFGDSFAYFDGQGDDKQIHKRQMARMDLALRTPGHDENDPSIGSYEYYGSGSLKRGRNNPPAGIRHRFNADFIPNSSEDKPNVILHSKRDSLTVLEFCPVECFDLFQFRNLCVYNFGSVYNAWLAINADYRRVDKVSRSSFIKAAELMGVPSEDPSVNRKDGDYLVGLEKPPLGRYSTTFTAGRVADLLRDPFNATQPLGVISCSDMCWMEFLYQKTLFVCLNGENRVASEIINKLESGGEFTGTNLVTDNRTGGTGLGITKSSLLPDGRLASEVLINPNPDLPHPEICPHLNKKSFRFLWHIKPRLEVLRRLCWQCGQVQRALGQTEHNLTCSLLSNPFYGEPSTSINMFFLFSATDPSPGGIDIRSDPLKAFNLLYLKSKTMARSEMVDENSADSRGNSVGHIVPNRVPAPTSTSMVKRKIAVERRVQTLLESECATNHNYRMIREAVRDAMRRGFGERRPLALWRFFLDPDDKGYTSMRDVVCILKRLQFPHSATTVWRALSKTTPENGCLVAEHWFGKSIGYLRQFRKRCLVMCADSVELFQQMDKSVNKDGEIRREEFHCFCREKFGLVRNTRANNFRDSRYIDFIFEQTLDSGRMRRAMTFEDFSYLILGRWHANPERVARDLVSQGLKGRMFGVPTDPVARFREVNDTNSYLQESIMRQIEQRQAVSRATNAATRTSLDDGANPFSEGKKSLVTKKMGAISARKKAIYGAKPGALGATVTAGGVEKPQATGTSELPGCELHSLTQQLMSFLQRENQTRFRQKEYCESLESPRRKVVMTGQSGEQGLTAGFGLSQGTNETVHLNKKAPQPPKESDDSASNKELQYLSREWTKHKMTELGVFKERFSISLRELCWRLNEGSFLNRERAIQDRDILLKQVEFLSSEVDEVTGLLRKSMWLHGTCPESQVIGKGNGAQITAERCGYSLDNFTRTNGFTDISGKNVDLSGYVTSASLQNTPLNWGWRDWPAIQDVYRNARNALLSIKF